MIHSLRFSFLRRHFRPVLVATSHLWLSICKYIKMKENVNSALQLYSIVTFQVLNSHMWLGATVLEGTDIDYFIIANSSIG